MREERFKFWSTLRKRQRKLSQDSLYWRAATPSIDVTSFLAGQERSPTPAQQIVSPPLVGRQVRKKSSKFVSLWRKK